MPPGSRGRLQMLRLAPWLAMLGPQKERQLDRPVLASLEALVPPANFYRQLEAQLDLGFVRTWVGDMYAERGRPSIDPVIFFKLQLILFFEGLRSERKLIETASLHLAQRWYLGYALDEPLPDHSSLTRIRTRLGVDIFRRFFEHIVELCQQAGLVWGKELVFDATKVRANADIDSLTPRFAQAAREHVTDLFAREAAAAPAADASPHSESVPTGAAVAGAAATAAVPSGGPVPVSFTGTPEQHSRLAAENQAQGKLLDQRRLDPQRPPSGPYRRIVDFRVSTTDADAAPMGSSAVAKLGYHDHYVVDGGKARIIVGVLVTPADVQDNQAFLDLLDRARFRFHLHVTRAVADAKYSTGENLRALAERGMRAYMPIADHEQASPFFKHQDFVYDPATESYRCPQGETLTFRGNSYTTRGGEVPGAGGDLCWLPAACPVHRQCQRAGRPSPVRRGLSRTGQAAADDRGVQEGVAQTAGLG